MIFARKLYIVEILVFSGCVLTCNTRLNHFIIHHSAALYNWLDIIHCFLSKASVCHHWWSRSCCSCTVTCQGHDQLKYTVHTRYWRICLSQNSVPVDCVEYCIEVYNYLSVCHPVLYVHIVYKWTVIMASLAVARRFASWDLFFLRSAVHFQLNFLTFC